MQYSIKNAQNNRFYFIRWKGNSSFLNKTIYRIQKRDGDLSLLPRPRVVVRHLRASERHAATAKRSTRHRQAQREVPPMGGD